VLAANGWSTGQLARFGFAVVGEGRVLDTERVKASPFAVHCSPKLRGFPVAVVRAGRCWTLDWLLCLLVIADRLRDGRGRGTG